MKCQHYHHPHHSHHQSHHHSHSHSHHHSNRPSPPPSSQQYFSSSLSSQHPGPVAISSSISSPPCCASSGNGNCGGGGCVGVSVGGLGPLSNNIGGPGYAGSATLPASINNNNNNININNNNNNNNNNNSVVNGFSSDYPSYYCSRSATGKSLQSSGGLMPCPEASSYPNHHQWHYSPCSMSLFVLSLVFILIWSSLLSGLLVTHSFKEHQTARHMAELFVLHKDVGQLAFAVGEEMLDSINSSLVLSRSDNHNPDDPASSNTPFNSKWNETDQLLQQVVQSLAQKGFIDLEIVIKENLSSLRTKCFDRLSSSMSSSVLDVGSNHTMNDTQNLVSLLLDCVRTFDKLFFRFDTILLKDNQWLSERHSKLTLTDLSIRNMPYTLFIRGIVHRFTALGLGLIFVRSNNSHSVFNVSEYFNYYYSSRQLIESSFVWNVRFLEKYLELENTDYKSDMLLNLFNDRQSLEQDNYLKMVDIFGQIFNYEFLTRLRSHIKKKNVESVERLLVNGSRTKFVTDQDANLLNIQLNTDMLESIGLEKLDQIISFNYNQVSHLNLSQKYDQLLRNQIGFMGRVQDFLNISIYAHLTQITINEQQNFLYHSVVASILILSVLFCLSLFLCSYCCGGGCQSSTSASAAYPASKSLSRRMRRHFWNISSSSSLFKSCFASSTGTPSTSRYPLLYKASPHHSQQQQQQHVHHYHGYPRSACCSSSPTSYHGHSSSSQNHKRSFGSNNLVGRHPVSLGNTSGSSSSGNSATKTALLTYKFENSRLGKLTETTLVSNTTTTPTSSVNNTESKNSFSKSRNASPSSGNNSTNPTNWCCGGSGTCSDNNATISCENSKCSTCCSCVSRSDHASLESTLKFSEEKSSSSSTSSSSSSSNSPSKESKKSISLSSSPLNSLTTESTIDVNGQKSRSSSSATEKLTSDTDSSTNTKTGIN